MAWLLLSRYGATVLTSGDQTKGAKVRSVSHKHRNGIETRPGLSNRITLRAHRDRAILFLTFPSQHELTLLFEQLNASGISEFD